MNFGEEEDEHWRGALIAPSEKTLVQPAARWLLSGDHSSPSSLTAFVMMQMSSSEEDDIKRAGSVTKPEHSSASEAARKKVIYFAVTRTERDNLAHGGGTWIMISLR